MKQFIIFYFLLFHCIKSQLTNEERKNLYKKVTKLLSFKEPFFSPLTDDSENDNIITYEASKINEIINKYNFPSSYNYLTEENITPVIKNQGSCGSCWSFASSTALSYRFHKQGIDVDLSPQYPLSCYLRSCSFGDYLIDSQFNLVKNGTVTEKCMPYSSSQGSDYNIEKCPTQCADGSDTIKYHSKNAYTTLFDYNKENYYDIVTLIIDQLITYGPVESQMFVYEDFDSLIGYSNCANTIYKYDQKSDYSGGHAVVIVGYGVQNNRYYWIIQNSWGKSFCDEGFVKIEFTEVGIEKVSFSEPYIEDNSPSKEITIKFYNRTEECSYGFTSSNPENYFEMYFKNGNSEIYYQCGSNPQSDNNEGICSISHRSAFNPRGTYKYDQHNGILNQNTYKLDFGSISNDFPFYGYDSIDSYWGNEKIYISQYENKIYLLYEPSKSNSNISPDIYPSSEGKTPLSQCRIKNVNNYLMIVCEIQQSEFSYFSSTKSNLSYNVLCGFRQEMYAQINILDTNKYPVFKIKRLLLENQGYTGSDNSISLVADVEGSVSQLNGEPLYFGGIIDTEYNNEFRQNVIVCEINNPKIGTNVYIYCEYIDDNVYRYNNAYLSHFIYQDFYDTPFQIVVEDNIEGENQYMQVISSDSIYFKINKFILVLLGLLFI